MNNKVRNGIIFLVIVALYGGFLLYDTHKPQTGSSPVIKVPLLFGKMIAYILYKI